MEMKGLLDFATSPMGQGLLAAGFGGLAGANRGTPINNIGRAGLAGLTGYSAASALQDQRLKREEAERVKAAIPTLYTQGPDGSMKFDTMAALKLGIDPKQVLDYANAPNAGRAKVARTQEVEGPDGGKQVIQLDEYGSPVGQGFAGYVAPQLVDTGDMKQFVKPSAGQSFSVGMSPSERDASQRGWAGIQVRQDANDVLRETNDINKQGQRTQIVTGADGTVMLVDKGTGEARPAVAPAGNPVRSGPAAEAADQRTRDANDVTALIDMAEQILPGATGSGIGAAADDAARFFGYSTEGGKKAAQLQAIGGALVMKMPRMEGPQSNYDQELYRQMAGKVNDTTATTEERAAALKVVRQIVNKYSGGQAQQQSQHTASKQQRTVARTGRTADGRKVVQYSDGSLEYGD